MTPDLHGEPRSPGPRDGLSHRGERGGVEGEAVGVEHRFVAERNHREAEPGEVPRALRARGGHARHPTEFASRGQPVGHGRGPGRSLSDGIAGGERHRADDAVGDHGPTVVGEGIRAIAARGEVAERIGLPVVGDEAAHLHLAVAVPGGQLLRGAEEDPQREHERQGKRDLEHQRHERADLVQDPDVAGAFYAEAAPHHGRHRRPRRPVGVGRPGEPQQHHHDDKREHRTAQGDGARLHPRTRCHPRRKRGPHPPQQPHESDTHTDGDAFEGEHRSHPECLHDSVAGGDHVEREQRHVDARPHHAEHLEGPDDHQRHPFAPDQSPDDERQHHDRHQRGGGRNVEHAQHEPQDEPLEAVAGDPQHHGGHERQREDRDDHPRRALLPHARRGPQEPPQAARAIGPAAAAPGTRVFGRRVFTGLPRVRVLAAHARNAGEAPASHSSEGCTYGSHTAVLCPPRGSTMVVSDSGSVAAAIISREVGAASTSLFP